MRYAMINALHQAIAAADLQNTDRVLITRKEAEEILRLLGGQCSPQWTPKGTDGKVQFYCVNCSKSFWSDSREDTECFEKWHYHTWYANCPTCKREVSQSDRYWR
jgi:DNA-directed RNA polymerase subunit RPC12/RpoP